MKRPAFLAPKIRKPKRQRLSAPKRLHFPERSRKILTEVKPLELTLVE